MSIPDISVSKSQMGSNSPTAHSMQPLDLVHHSGNNLSKRCSRRIAVLRQGIYSLASQVNDLVGKNPAAFIASGVYSFLTCNYWPLATTGALFVSNKISQVFKRQIKSQKSIEKNDKAVYSKLLIDTAFRLIDEITDLKSQNSSESISIKIKEKIEALCQCLFQDEDIDLKIFEKLVQSKQRWIIFRSLLASIKIESWPYDPKKQSFISLIKNNIDKICKDQGSEILPLSYYKAAMLQKIEENLPPLNESKDHQFIRKFIAGQNIIFLDKEILIRSRINNISNIRDQDGNVIKKYISENGKTVFPQYSPKSCGPTCVCMLFNDRQLQYPIDFICDFSSFFTDRLKTLLMDKIAKVNKTEVKSKSSKDFLKQLKANIDKDGSAIMHLERGHFIICDYISDDFKKIRIRDPYHGWEITITAKAFLSSCFYSDSQSMYYGHYFTEILQIDNH